MKLLVRSLVSSIDASFGWRVARVVAVLVMSMVLDTTPALAQTRTAPAATQHALDELANCRAQRRPECATDTPTATLLPTWTPAPTSTPTLEPTDDPTVTPTSTPEPCWLTDPDIGDPDNSYVVFDYSGAPVPCQTDGLAETPTTQPTDMPSATPTPVVIAQRAPAPPAPPAPAPQVAIQQQTVVVVQTVVVLVTPTPPPAALTQTPRPSSTPTRTSTPSPTETVARTPTGMPTGMAIGSLGAPSRPAPTSGPPVRWDWGGFLRSGAIVLAVVCVLVVVFSRRRVVAWRPRGKGGQRTHA